MALSIDQMNQMFGKPGSNTPGPLSPKTPASRPSDADVAKIFGISSKTSVLPKPVEPPKNDFWGGAAGVAMSTLTGQAPKIEDVRKASAPLVEGAKAGAAAVNEMGKSTLAGRLEQKMGVVNPLRKSVEEVTAGQSGDAARMGVQEFEGGAQKVVEAVNPATNMRPEDRLVRGVGGVVDMTSGGLNTAFAPASAAIEQVGGVRDVVGAGMGALHTVTQSAGKAAIDQLGIDPNSEQAQVLQKAVDTLGNLGLLKVTHDTTKALGREGDITEANKALDIAKQSGDAAAIDAATSALEKATLAPAPSAVGNVGAGMYKAAGDVVKAPLEYFGEKTGLKDFLSKTPEQLQREKTIKGFERQNTALKSVNKSFEDNTKVYQNPDGTTTKVTPIDTFSKYNIKPTIEGGKINMGDYKTGSGALGEIKTKISELDSKIDTALRNSGKVVPLEEFRAEAIARAKANPALKQAGTVASTVAKIEARFEDYKNSYGDALDIAEINNIRKIANKDWSPDTQDVSRIVGDVTRDKVYDLSGDTTVKNALKEQGELLAAKKYAQKLHKTTVVGGRLGNYAGRTLGAIAGLTLTGLGPLGPLAGMMGGEYFANAMQKAQFESPLAGIRGSFQSSKSIEPIQTAKATNIMASNIENVGKEVPKASIPKTNPLKASIPEAKPQVKGDVVNAGEVAKATPESAKVEPLPEHQAAPLLFEAKKYSNINDFIDKNYFKIEKKEGGRSVLKNKNGELTFSIDKEANEFIIEDLEAYQKRQGTGTALLKYAEMLADKKGLDVSFAAEPQDSSISKADLWDFYEKNGYDNTSGLMFKANADLWAGKLPTKSQLTDIWNKVHRK